MKVVKLVPFTESMLLSSNATETVATYSSGTTYALDAEVNYANSIYVSLVSGNIGNQPDTSPNFWIRKSSNNKYSMFDEFVNTQTTRSTNLTVEVNPGVIFNSVNFFNLSGGNSLLVEVKDGIAGPVVYTKTVSLDDTPIVDWYMYFFEPYDFKSDIVLTDIPPYSSGVITVTFTGSGTVGIGNMVFGTVYPLGLTQYGASAGIRDYSAKEANIFGITSLVQRAFSKRMDAQIFVENADIRFVRKLLEELRATPAVWIGSDDSIYDILSVYGYYRDFNIEITYPSFSICRLEVEGLV